MAFLTMKCNEDCLKLFPNIHGYIEVEYRLKIKKFLVYNTISETDSVTNHGKRYLTNLCVYSLNYSW